jgi:hypothetical protein
VTRKRKGFLYLIFALTILFYAVPRLPIYSIDSAASLFAVVWLCFALLIIAANLYHLFGVDREEEEAYRKVQRMKRWKMEQQLLKLSRMRSAQR